MLLLQAAIGAANDWADASTDAVAKPGKPIPAGLVMRPVALGVAAVAGSTGLALAASCGPLPLAIAAAGFMAGIAYDLGIKATAWSWVPFAVGIGLLPAFAWVGSVGHLPPAFGVVIPVAMLAGAALAIANALADVDRDSLAGVGTVATSLGPTASRRAGAVLEAIVAAAAIGSAIGMGGEPAWIAVLVVGVGLVGLGVGVGWSRRPSALQHAWEVQAIGLVVIAAGWVGSLAAAGRLAG